MGVQTNNTKALEELFAPHKKEMDILSEALKEVNQEDVEKKKGAAKELIRKCLDLQSRMDQAERTFNSEKKKWDKELGKTINRLKNMVAGRPQNEGVEDEKEGDEAAAAEDTES